MSLVLPTVFTAQDSSYVKTVKAMQRSMVQFGDKSEAAIAQVERQFGQLQRKAQAVAQRSALIGLAVVAPLGLAAKAASDFEAQMGNVSTLVDTNVESMAEMGAQVLDISTRVPVATEELTKGLYDVRSAGIAAGDAMGVLEESAKLSVAGLSTVDEATNIMTSSLNAFASENLSAAKTSDILFKTVKAGKTTISELSQGFGAVAPVIESAGVKFADFQAATAALTTLGTPATQAQNQLRSAIVALQKPTSEMEKIFTKLGVTSDKELIQKFGGMGEAFKAVQDAGNELGINMSKAWSRVEATAAVTALVGSTNETYINTLKDMNSEVSAVDKAFAKQLGTSDKQAQLIRNNMQALAVTAGTQLLPIVTELIGEVIPLVKGLMSWAQENPGIVKSVIQLALGAAALSFAISGIATVVSVASGVMKMWGLVVKGYQAILGIASIAQWAWAAAVNAGLWPILAIAAAVAALIAVIAIIIKKWDEWGAAISVFMGPLGFVISLIQSFRRNWDMVVEGFKTGGILGALKAIKVVIIDALLQPLQQLLDIIGKLPGGIGDAAKSAAKSIEGYREGMGVNMPQPIVTNTEETPVVDANAARNEQITKQVTENTSRSMLDVNINSNGNNAEVVPTGPMTGINLSTTMGGF